MNATAEVIAMKQTPKPLVAIETITPAMATRYLANMVANRKPSEGKIIEYALAMEGGRWSLNGETVKFNDDGQLIDGQNRLNACLLSGRAFDTYVVRGLSDERAFATIDVGKNRSHSDMLAIAGISNQSQVAAAAALLIMYEAKTIGWSGPTSRRPARRSGVLAKVKSMPTATQLLQKDELLEWVGAHHDELQEAVRKCFAATKARRLMTPAVLSAAYFLAKKTPIDADAFIDDINHGIGLAANDPVRALREKLILNASSKAKLSRYTLFGIVLKAMRKRIDGQHMSVMRLVEGEPFPRVD